MPIGARREVAMARRSGSKRPRRALVGLTLPGGSDQHDRRAVAIEAVSLRLVLHLEDRDPLRSAIQSPPFHARALGHAEQGSAQLREDRTFPRMLSSSPG